MWPNRRMGQYITPQDMQEESHDEAFHEANAPVDLLLFTSLNTYAAVQRSSTIRPLPCDCTELFIDEDPEDTNILPRNGVQTVRLQVLSVRSTEMASTSCLRPASPPYPHMMYYPDPLPREQSSSPERRPSDITLSRQNNNVQTDEESDHAITGPEVSRTNFSREPLSDAELSPIMVKRSRLTTTATRRKDLPTPEPTLARRRLRAGRRLAAATRLTSQVADRVVKYARCIRNIYESDMGCLNCGLLPICPVTGKCGHTRCSRCVTDTITCPCGNDSFSQLPVNILIRDLIGKTTSDGPSARTMPVRASATSAFTTEDIDVAVMETDETVLIPPLIGASGSCRSHIRLRRRARAGTPDFGGPKRIPMTPRARFNHALDLLRLGLHRQAVPYLALAAAAGQPELRQARVLLAQAITMLSNNRDPRGLTTQLTRSVRRLTAASRAWIKPTDMECILCCDTFTDPVTTPCGHMFCRTCLERTLDYGKRCPLCLRDLITFALPETRNTSFVQAALKSINADVTPLPLEPDLIPIFVCTVAYPSIPCPLFIFDPRYWLMIRRVLESGSRRFGMVACDKGQDYVDYGTILEVRDCVHLEDGRSILSTVGLSRFKVIERGVRDGCDVARIVPITDVIGEYYEPWDIKVLAQRILFKALLWLSRLNAKVLADIETAFGVLQHHGFFDDCWWESTDGPSWLWWLVAVLPLRSQIKVLILSTNCLVKRMMAVARTLDAVDHGHPSTSHPRSLRRTVSVDETQSMERRAT